MQGILFCTHRKGSKEALRGEGLFNRATKVLTTIYPAPLSHYRTILKDVKGIKSKMD